MKQLMIDYEELKRKLYEKAAIAQAQRNIEFENGHIELGLEQGTIAATMYLAAALAADLAKVIEVKDEQTDYYND